MTHVCVLLIPYQGGFENFTRYLRHMFQEHHLVRPNVTVQIRDLTVTTRVRGTHPPG
jgi:hypothetical protein